MTSSLFFLSTLNYDARSTTHQIYKQVRIVGATDGGLIRKLFSCSSTANGTKCHGFEQKTLLSTLFTVSLNKIGHIFYSHEEAKLGQALNVLSTKNIIYYTLNVI